MTTIAAVNQKLAQIFHSALLHRDWDQLATILHSDVAWVLPGDNHISGAAEGLTDVLARAALIASYGPSFTLEHVLFSRDNFALAIHNQATRGDLVLDEHLATVCTVKQGKISRIETYLSDIEGMDAFFAGPPA
ncbi:nuclear transport factor 2 family protein [Mycolicibacterium aubagnense]